MMSLAEDGCKFEQESTLVFLQKERIQEMFNLVDKFDGKLTSFVADPLYRKGNNEFLLC